MTLTLTEKERSPFTTSPCAHSWAPAGSLGILCGLTRTTSGDLPGRIVPKRGRCSLGVGQRCWVTLAFRRDASVATGVLGQYFSCRFRNKLRRRTVWSRCWACENLRATKPLLHPEPELEAARREHPLNSLCKSLSGSWGSTKQMRGAEAKTGIGTLIWVNGLSRAVMDSLLDRHPAGARRESVIIYQMHF